MMQNTSGYSKNAINKPKTKVRLGILAVIFLIFAVAYFDRSNVSVLIADKAYTGALGITGNAGSQGLLTSIFLLFYGAGCFFVGPIVNRVGAKKAIASCLLLWAIVMFIMGGVSNFYVTLIGRALLGISESMTSPATSKLIQTWFPVKERAKANGVWFMGIQISMITGIPLVTALISSIGWHGSFYTLGLLNIIPLILCLFLVYNTVESHPKVSKEEADYISAGRAEEVTQGSKIITSYKFLKNSTFWYSTVVYSMTLALAWATNAWVPSYLKNIFGFSWAQMGIWSALPSLAGLIALIVFSPLMDKFNSRSTYTLISCVCMSAFIFIVTTCKISALALAFISLALACVNIANSSLFTILQNGMNASEVATAVGFFTAVAYIWSSIFPYVMGAIYTKTNSFTIGFYVLGACGVVSIIASIPLFKRRL